MQTIKIVATPSDKPWVLAYATTPDGQGAKTPKMVGGKWSDKLATGTYYFSLTVTANGQTSCEIVVTADGVGVRDLKYLVPGNPAMPVTFPEPWIMDVK